MHSQDDDDDDDDDDDAAPIVAPTAAPVAAPTTSPTTYCESLESQIYEAEFQQNAAEFEASLEFLGFVTTPVPLPQYSTTRVLVTECIAGQHLSKLTEAAGLQMTRMAVEACTASLVLTGFVHADPHEGNIMLEDDGRLVFLEPAAGAVVGPC